MKAKLISMYEYWSVSFDTSEGCAKGVDGALFETKEAADTIAALPLGYYGSTGTAYRKVSETLPDKQVWPTALEWAKQKLTYAEMEKFGILPK